MGATEEQMLLLSGANVSHVSYILLLYSVSFLLFLFVAMLLHLYAVHAFPAPASSATANAKVVAGGRINGHVTGDQRLRDAEEFELEGLMSEDEEGSPGEARKENGRVG